MRAARKVVPTLAIVVAVATAATVGGCGDRAGSAELVDAVLVEVDARDNAFRPDRMTVPAGAEVQWTNRGRNIHDLDRNEVILDGEFSLQNGIRVLADGVAIENLTARNYTTFGSRAVDAHSTAQSLLGTRTAGTARTSTALTIARISRGAPTARARPRTRSSCRCS